MTNSELFSCTTIVLKFEVSLLVIVLEGLNVLLGVIPLYTKMYFVIFCLIVRGRSRSN